MMNVSMNVPKPELYWRCSGCGEVDHERADSVGAHACGSARSQWEPVAVLPVAELERLRVCEMAAKGLAEEHVAMGREIKRMRGALQRQAIRFIRTQNNWCSGRAGLAHSHGDDYMYHYFLASAKKYNKHLGRLLACEAVKGGA